MQDLANGFAMPKNNKRYALHYRVRQKGFTLKTKDKTVFVYPNSHLPKSLKRLRDEFHYSLQILAL